MRTNYYHQLLQHLEPEQISLQSRTKVTGNDFQQNLSMEENGAIKARKESFRNQQPQESFGSFENHALIDLK